MQALIIEIVDGPHAAPHYRLGHRIEGHPAQAAELIRAIIVPKGTEDGHCTADLQLLLKNERGETVGAAVAMVTGGLIQALAGSINGVEDRQAAPPPGWVDTMALEMAQRIVPRQGQTIEAYTLLVAGVQCRIIKIIRDTHGV